MSSMFTYFVSLLDEAQEPEKVEVEPKDKTKIQSKARIQKQKPEKDHKTMNRKPVVPPVKFI